MHAREIRRHTGLGDDKINAVEIRLEPRLRGQRGKDRISEPVVGRRQKRYLVSSHIERDRRGAGRWRQKQRAAIESLQHIELVQPAGIRRRAVGNTGEIHRHAARAKRAAGGARHGAGVGPAGEQIRQQPLLRAARGGGGKRLERGFQRGTRIKAGRLAQIAHHAAAHHVGQAHHIGGHRDLGGEIPLESIGRQIHIRRLALGAIDAGVLPRGRNAIAIGPQHAGRRFGQIDRRNLQRIQREQLARLRHPILIHIAPHTKRSPVGIQRADHAVVVGILRHHRRETIGGEHASANRGGIAKQLATVVDGAVFVEIQRQKTIITRQPAGAHPHAVIAVIEGDPIGGLRGDGFNAVTVEIEHERIAAGRGLGGGVVSRDGCRLAERHHTQGCKPIPFAQLAQRRPDLPEPAQIKCCKGRFKLVTILKVGHGVATHLDRRIKWIARLCVNGVDHQIGNAVGRRANTHAVRKAGQCRDIQTLQISRGILPRLAGCVVSRLRGIRDGPIERHLGLQLRDVAVDGDA